MLRRFVLLLLAGVAPVAAGCGDERGAGAETPGAAVKAFLQPFAEAPAPGSEAGDSEVDCGAAVAALTAYTGDTGGMTSPSTIASEVRREETDGDSSLVTVHLRYGSGDDTPESLRPPAEGTAKVLVVRRDGRWWVATPQAFNPLHTADGGFTVGELRAEHRELLESAKR